MKFEARHPFTTESRKALRDTIEYFEDLYENGWSKKWEHISDVWDETPICKKYCKYNTCKGCPFSDEDDDECGSLFGVSSVHITNDRRAYNLAEKIMDGSVRRHDETVKKILQNLYNVRPPEMRAFGW